MGKVQIELTEERAISILGTLDNDVFEAQKVLEEMKETGDEAMVRRFKSDKSESDADFREFGEQVKEQIDDNLMEDLAFINTDLLE
jgi:hypothetical protein